MAEQATGGRLTPDVFKGEAAAWPDWSFSYESYSVKHSVGGPQTLREAVVVTPAPGGSGSAARRCHKGIRLQGV